MLLDGNEPGATSTPTVPETPPAPPATEPTQGGTPAEPNPPAEPEKQDRLFTRDEVTQIVTKRLNRAVGKFYEKLGIKGEEELEEYLQGRNLLQTENDDLKNKNLELSRTNSFLKNNINPERYDDIVAYFKGKGIDFSEEELLKNLATHPEWLNKPVAPAAPEQKPQATLEVLTPGRGTTIPESEEEKMDRVFGFKK